MADAIPTTDLSRVTLYVGGLPKFLKNNEFKSIFLPFGPIVDFKLMSQWQEQEQHQHHHHRRNHHHRQQHHFRRPSRKTRGYGFIRFEDPDDAKHAVFNMNKTEYRNHILTVMNATSQQMEEGLPVLDVEDKEKFLEDQLGLDETFKKSIGTEKELVHDGSVNDQMDDDQEEDEEAGEQDEAHFDDDDEEEEEEGKDESYDPQAIYGEDDYAPYDTFHDEEEDDAMTS